MDPDWLASIKETNGINLDNYVPQQRSYNSIVFVHKKYLKEPEPVEENKEPEKIKTKKVKKIKHDKKHTQQDKSQQFNNDKNTGSNSKTYNIDTNNNNTVLDQTIRFAKNLVPLVLPSSEDKSNVFYTIKSSKRHRKVEKKRQEPSFNHNEFAHEREEPRKVVETYRKVKKESFSVRESVSHSSNTLDDLNINQSLCCTFSEQSEKKCHKKEKSHSKKINQDHKFAISESFEAVATENATGDAKIKIHLMNDKDKNFLCESIREPVLNAIRDCIFEMNNKTINTEINIVQEFIKCNSQKLDNILDKLSCIEKKLFSHEKKLYNHEKYIDTHNKLINTHDKKIDVHDKQLDNYEKQINKYEQNLDVHQKTLHTHESKLNSYEKMLKSHEEKLDDPGMMLDKKKEQQQKERKCVIQTEEKRVPEPKVQDCKRSSKASTLEELAVDLIEIDEEYSSEEELHQELLDRRSKSTVVIDLAQENKEKKRLEKLGAGEFPNSIKESTSGVEKLERPNRIPARFCWTDGALRKK